jgi:hypothetical protein
MKVTKANIIKAIHEETGITPELARDEGTYHWAGKEACLFSDTCTYISTFKHPKISVASFVTNFKEKVALVEEEFRKPIAEVVSEIDWNVEFEQ